MTVEISWDVAVADAGEGIREEMIRQVERGEIYRSARETWYKRLPDDQRTSYYGLFPPVTDPVLDSLLSLLLGTGVIRVSAVDGVAGLLKAHVN